MLAVDEKNVTMPMRYPLPEACTDGTVLDPSADIHCRPIPAFERSGPREDGNTLTVDSIALYHYVLKSMEDFKIKIARGGGDKFKRDESYFNKIDRCLFCSRYDVHFFLHRCRSTVHVHAIHE